MSEKTMRENRANSEQLKLTMVKPMKFWKISVTSVEIVFPYCRDGVIKCAKRNKT